ncbi:zf-HC2 domain-containing protein [Saccharopolyspora rhizosphaerae]|nr:zf-HC2 domain-containing protein [Saccharopolyspora rhizosphaerae]
MIIRTGRAGTGTTHSTGHERFQDLLSAYATGDLDDVEWLMMRTHLSECAHCQAQMSRPPLWNRAAPRLITSEHEVPDRSARDAAPGWTVALGVVLVATLVAFGVGYALGGS